MMCKKKVEKEKEIKKLKKKTKPLVMVFLTVLSLSIIPVLQVEASYMSLIKRPYMYEPDDLRIDHEYVYERFDADLDKIEDELEELIDTATVPEEMVRVIVVLSEPYTEEQLDAMRESGEVIHTYEHALNGFSGWIPLNRIRTLADRVGPHLEIIEESEQDQMNLDESTRIIGARPVVWETYGYKGSSDFSIAIIDSGIDDSHPDFPSDKIVKWKDVTIDREWQPVDYSGHGSHVASIAAGTGDTYGKGTITEIQTTFSGTLPEAGFGYRDRFEVMEPGPLIIDATVSHGEFKIKLYDPDGDLAVADSTPPYHIEGTANVAGTWSVGAYNPTDSSDPSGRPFSVVVTYPYRDVGDGYNLFAGVAPENRLVMIKKVENDGGSSIDDTLDAFDWIIENKETYAIKVVNLSFSMSKGETKLSYRNAANEVVENGIILTTSAGNEYNDGYTMGDPNLAEKVITVAATSDSDRITSYSSNGPSGSGKPDVAAPGGTSPYTSYAGTLITAVDTNDADAKTVGFADRNPDDYTNMYGTSMSSPHVAGEAALIIQALESNGYTWTYTEQDALKVKMIILMTAVETNKIGEDPDGLGGIAPNTPPLNRGDKDLVEGYGRINVDAAIEAATMTHTIGTAEQATLGSSSTSKKVWARKVDLQANQQYEFALDIPDDADYDLYLYDGDPDSIGDPVILDKSTSEPIGEDETIKYESTTTQSAYIVVKWVSGDGEFDLSSVLPSTARIELCYDDGTAETCWYWDKAGGMFAVRFTPPTSGRLTECSFYISEETDAILYAFKVHIMDADRSDIISPLLKAPASTGWFHVDLSTYEITVSQDVDIYVAMESIVANAPCLGDDTSDPDGRSWDYNGVTWVQYAEGDYLIRAVIESTARIELCYDDGTAEESWNYWPYDPFAIFTGGPGGRSAAAVRFTPPSTGRLVECSFYVVRSLFGLPDVSVLVFDIRQASNLTPPILLTSYVFGWCHVDLSTYDVTVSSGVDFYIEIMPHGSEFGLGVDTSDPDGRSWFWDGTSQLFLWEPLGVDLMIRAVIEPSPFLPTDLNQDGIVNIVDVGIVTRAYGTKPGDENWNAIADMDNNKEINIVDVSIVSLDYGKTT